jgi:hypothetical protein
MSDFNQLSPVPATSSSAKCKVRYANHFAFCISELRILIKNDGDSFFVSSKTLINACFTENKALTFQVRYFPESFFILCFNLSNFYRHFKMAPSV